MSRFKIHLPKIPNVALEVTRQLMKPHAEYSKSRIVNEIEKKDIELLDTDEYVVVHNINGSLILPKIKENLIGQEILILNSDIDNTKKGINIITADGDFIFDRDDQNLNRTTMQLGTQRYLAFKDHDNKTKWYNTN